MEHDVAFDTNPSFPLMHRIFLPVYSYFALHGLKVIVKSNYKVTCTIATHKNLLQSTVLQREQNVKQ